MGSKLGRDEVEIKSKQGRNQVAKTAQIMCCDAWIFRRERSGMRERGLRDTTETRLELVTFRVLNGAGQKEAASDDHSPMLGSCSRRESAIPATEETPGTFRDFFGGQAPHSSPKPFLRTISSFQLARVGRARWSREMPGVQNSGGG